MARLTLTPPRAVVIYCSDNRFQAAFQEFIREHLGLAPGEFTPLVIPGSVFPIGLTARLQLPKQFKIFIEQLSLILNNHKGHPVQIVVITHDDCRGQQFLVQKIAKFLPFSHDRHRDELQLSLKVLHEIAEHFVPDCDVELYHAVIAGDEVIFEETIAGKQVWPKEVRRSGAQPGKRAGEGN
ncbi:MAG: hypothetical protein EHM61_04385 [Acidobacteria bacterium]|nr:MAG: hypothetical protein EHM61_04385 [Acidobacteriota bacterium]